MQIKDCYLLGCVSKTIGNKGEVVFFIDADNPAKYKTLKSVFIEIGGQLVPFFIKKIKINKNTAIVSIDGLDSVEKSIMLVSTKIYLPLELLPKLKGNNFYFHEVTGFTVIDNYKGNIGIIESIIENSGNPLIQIKSGEKEILIPLKKKFIKKVDRENRIIEIEAPEGLIDVYLG
ncbi:MAG: ribosome maturation factor RimM [Bacteroidales bacterium]|nr:ribosome maturation factor RimM [Bacteroidales bacterium]